MWPAITSLFHPPLKSTCFGHLIFGEAVVKLKSSHRLEAIMVAGVPVSTKSNALFPLISARTINPFWRDTVSGKISNWENDWALSRVGLEAEANSTAEISSEAATRTENVPRSGAEPLIIKAPEDSTALHNAKPIELVCSIPHVF